MGGVEVDHSWLELYKRRLEFSQESILETLE
jgi:hypothetical protein